MNIKKVLDIYEVIKNRLPKTYPRPSLAFFENEEALLANNRMERDETETVYAVCDPDSSMIHLPLHMSFELISKGKSITRNQKLINMSEETISHTLLHEIAHLLYCERYGEDSEQFDDENLCDQFANRWVKILKKEKLIE